ncbi:hypothetical protein FA95DRAFT_872545 [Auriscalpium vulgare]|uniref:Uncharacterized protein n=1 Tax=Auriscalpium vulgare TaxID=40419 RepID=A0ACB8RZ66_9AGAM|nr:hypothetical protein FA95DRAFT_872545 [Auriscalpium vulgare]
MSVFGEVWRAAREGVRCTRRMRTRRDSRDATQRHAHKTGRLRLVSRLRPTQTHSDSTRPQPPPPADIDKSSPLSEAQSLLTLSLCSCSSQSIAHVIPPVLQRLDRRRNLLSPAPTGVALAPKVGRSWSECQVRPLLVCSHVLQTHGPISRSLCHYSDNSCGFTCAMD